MNFVSFVPPSGRGSWGVEIDGVIYDLGPTGTDLAEDLLGAVRAGLIGNLQEAEIKDAPEHRVADVCYAPPIPNPGKIFCIGVNYHAHRIEGSRPEVAAPTVFTRFSDSQMGHENLAIRPYCTESFDYEGEVALVIGEEGFRISCEDALNHVAGYAVYNDFSVRDWQKAASQWIPGKNFPSTGAFGPWLVPAKCLPAFNEVRLQTRVNGEIRQDAYLDQLIFDIPSIIEHVSGFSPLRPGDVIVTGTPGGVGAFWEPNGLLNHGDVVEVEVTGLGVLRNTVQQEATPA